MTSVQYVYEATGKTGMVQPHLQYVDTLLPGSPKRLSLSHPPPSLDEFWRLLLLVPNINHSDRQQGSHLQVPSRLWDSYPLAICELQCTT